MARAYRPGLDPVPASVKAIADRAEAASAFTTDIAGIKPKARPSKKVTEAVERAVDAAADKADKTDRVMTKHEFCRRTGFDRHTLDGWIAKGAPVESAGGKGEEYRIDLRAIWKWREAYVIDEAMTKSGVVSGGGSLGGKVGFLGHVWLKPGEEIKAMKDYLAMGVDQKRLAHIDDLEAAYNRALSIIRQSVMAIPERLYREKAGFPEERIQKWRKDAIEASKHALGEAESVIKKAFKAARSFD